MERLGMALCCLALACSPAHSSEPIATEEIRAAIEKSLPLLENSAREFTRHRECFSCHHQAITVLAMQAAQEQGLTVDQEEVQRQVAWTAQFLGRNEERYREGKGQGGQADTAGYALWTLASGRQTPDKVTESVVQYLLLRHADLDHWKPTSQRPPSEASAFTTTFLAIQGLSSFASDEQREAAGTRIEKARAWLVSAQAIDTEDHVFRLRGLQAASADKETMGTASSELLALQRDDGGWAQLDDLDSDAYATGSALAALHETGALTAADEPYQRGLRYLLRTQLEDGSWQVHTRSVPIQEYFETGFPHGADQFISMSATGWSVIALTAGMPGK
jgi:N-acyl-D-amino-acid deacylase